MPPEANSIKARRFRSGAGDVDHAQPGWVIGHVGAGAHRLDVVRLARRVEGAYRHQAAAATGNATRTAMAHRLPPKLRGADRAGPFSIK